MPLYETHCERDGVLEAQYPMERSEEDFLECPACGLPAPRIVSVPAMQPDDYWNGGRYSITLGRRFNSRKEQRDYERRKGVAPGGGLYDTGAARTVRRANEYREQRRAQKREAAIAKTVREVMI